MTCARLEHVHIPALSLLLLLLLVLLWMEFSLDDLYNSSESSRLNHFIVYKFIYIYI